MVVNLERLRSPADSDYQVEISLLYGGYGQSPRQRFQPTDRTQFKKDEWIGFEVRANRPGYLTLLSIWPTGEAVRIYPNELIRGSQERRQGYITGTVKIPLPEDDPKAEWGFQIDHPLGSEFIKAFLTDQPSGIFADAPRLSRDLNAYRGTEAGSTATKSIFRDLSGGIGGQASSRGGINIGIASRDLDGASERGPRAAVPRLVSEAEGPAGPVQGGPGASHEQPLTPAELQSLANAGNWAESSISFVTTKE